MKSVPIILVLCSTSVFSQVFDWGFTSQLLGVPGRVEGQITIDSNANTAEISGTFTTPTPAVRSVNLSSVTVIPGDFPNVETLTVTASIQFTVDPVSIQFYNSPAVPTSAGGYIFTTPYTGSDFTADVQYTYTLRENGVQFASGSGLYEIAGRPTFLAIDVREYPNGTAVGFNAFPLFPVQPASIFSETSPGGVPISYNRIAFGNFAPIPEPSSIALASGLALLSLVGLKKLR